MWVTTCGFKSHLPHVKKGHKKGVPIIFQLILLFTLLVQSFFVSPFLHILLSFNYVFGGPSSLSIIFSVFSLFSFVLTVIITPFFNLSTHFSKIFSNYLTFCTLYCRRLISLDFILPLPPLQGFSVYLHQILYPKTHNMPTTVMLQ